MLLAKINNLKTIGEIQGSVNMNELTFSTISITNAYRVQLKIIIMKRIVSSYALLIACFWIIPCMAQTKILSNRHEIRLGMGAIWHPEYGYNNYNDYYFLPIGSDIHYLGDKTGTPAIDLAYSYRLTKWLSLGATLSYVGLYQKTYNLYTDALYKKNSEHFIGLTPTAHFDWFRSNSIKLYSRIGFGLAYYIEKSRYRSGSLRRENEYTLTPTIDLIPIGISVGRKVFVFSELGASNIGIVKVGIGYRFNYKTGKLL